MISDPGVILVYVKYEPVSWRGREIACKGNENFHFWDDAAALRDLRDCID